ncbi:hypothetical protein L0U95_32585 (plasmid) [Burkholderia cenocepacia]|nr:hypothetical protein [Burkholderia cenocepacia]UJH78495.1 hypothetical protein L0U95_32585 [Burkholderia cenocepacia]
MKKRFTDEQIIRISREAESRDGPVLRRTLISIRSCSRRRPRHAIT